MAGTLITGIAGQDGGYLAERLTAAGEQVHGTLRPGDPVPDHLSALGDAVVLHDLELTDTAATAELITRIEPERLVNLAGISSVALSWSQPTLTAQVNGSVVAQLLDLAWQQQERTGSAVRFLQASSAEVFAGADTSPQSEATPLSPRSPYGASKAFAHHLVQVYRARGLFAVNAVLYNHESPRRPTTFVTRKITAGAAAIAQGRATELVLGNLDARRDWGWAPDYVDAMARALQADAPDDYVVATGQAHSVRDFVAAAMLRAGVDDWQDRVRTDPAFFRPADAVELVGDATRARTDLGWTPTVDFPELVGRMVDHDLTTR